MLFLLVISFLQQKHAVLKENLLFSIAPHVPKISHTLFKIVPKHTKFIPFAFLLCFHYLQNINGKYVE